jgi:tRNA-(ms[2]io[6]A)-hydroxylase
MKPAAPATDSGGAAGALPAPQVLGAATPGAWFDAAVADPATLLLDHANCEKKAASTALALMFTYADDLRLCQQLSRIAREELRHFEQVSQMMRRLGIPFRRLAPGRYAEGLRRAVAGREPERKLDLLLVGALIEARSCERFEGLVPGLDEPLSGFYRQLMASEARHRAFYIEAAARHAAAHGLDFAAHLGVLAALEAGLVTDPDPDLRFHSGPPARTATPVS